MSGNEKAPPHLAIFGIVSLAVASGLFFLWKDRILFPAIIPAKTRVLSLQKIEESSPAWQITEKNTSVLLSEIDPKKSETSRFSEKKK